MPRTIKLKLAFSPEISRRKRLYDLKKWAKCLIREGDLNILEIQHYNNMSYIIFENTYSSKRISSFRYQMAE